MHHSTHFQYPIIPPPPPLIIAPQDTIVLILLNSLLLLIRGVINGTVLIHVLAKKALKEIPIFFMDVGVNFLYHVLYLSL
jgi:hypothetical protein